MASSPSNRVEKLVGHLSLNSVSSGPPAVSAWKDGDVCIVSAVRTPMGSFNGDLASLSAPQLGAVAIKAALRGAGVSPGDVDEVFMGNVLSAGIGQAPARQAALAAGIPDKVPCTTVNKVCSSGMKAVMFGALTIKAKEARVVVAGGMESMTNVPYYLPQARQGHRMGDKKVIDGMMYDGLRDPYDKMAMGVCGDLCSEKYGISRQEQDSHAAESYRRSLQATEAGWFQEEIVPVEVKVRKKGTRTITKDQECRAVEAKGLGKLRAAFTKTGSVTAGNASVISDGAACLVLCSGSFARERGLRVLAVLAGQADAAQAPKEFTTAPSLAIPRALARAGLRQDQVALFEINEAFSVVALANQKLLKIPSDRVNVHGGAVSMGHPLGTSGARILVTLIHALRRRGEKVGVAGICNGGGGASACVVVCR